MSFPVFCDQWTGGIFRREALEDAREDMHMNMERMYGQKVTVWRAFLPAEGNFRQLSLNAIVFTPQIEDLEQLSESQRQSILELRKALDGARNDLKEGQKDNVALRNKVKLIESTSFRIVLFTNYNCVQKNSKKNFQKISKNFLSILSFLKMASSRIMFLREPIF